MPKQITSALLATYTVWELWSCAAQFYLCCYYYNQRRRNKSSDVLWASRSMYTSILHYLMTVVYKHVYIVCVCIVNNITLCWLKSIVSVKCSIYTYYIHLMLSFKTTALCNVYIYIWYIIYYSWPPGTRQHDNIVVSTLITYLVQFLFIVEQISLHPLFLTTHRAKINLSLYNIIRLSVALWLWGRGYVHFIWPKSMVDFFDDDNFIPYISTCIVITIWCT